MFLLTALALAQTPADAHGHHAACGDGATVSHSFSNAEHWATVFDDPARDAWQKPEVLVPALKLPRNGTVADIGAGTGYFNARLAAAVGKKGKVIAVDIEPNLVCHMARRALKERTLEVEPRLGTAGDPLLTAGEVDVVMTVDTYHHIDARVDYFRRLGSTVRQNGRLVVVDFKPGDLPVGPGPDHKISPEQVDRELAEAGWTRTQALDDLLPYQFVHVYTRGPATPR